MINNIAWGVNGHSEKHYLCGHCELMFGAVADPWEIEHECDKTLPQGTNRDKLAKGYVGPAASWAKPFCRR